jgi:LmbE family N-acetylglucosaminyl deacetylase
MSEQKYIAAEPISTPFKIVAIAAHHDDLEFGISGSIARWTSEGADVSYVIVTNGGAGSNEPDIDLQELIETRRHEQLAAAAAVGVTDVHFLGYQDGVLQPTIELRKTLTRILRDLKPDRVICQDPTTVFFGDGYINHPDHRAAGEAAIYATFPSSETRPIFPELLEEGYEPHKVKELWLTLSQNPTHYVDISDGFDKKVTSLRAHVSQLGSAEVFENGVMKWIQEAFGESGKRVGVQYAEFFKVMTLVRANEDPREKDLETVAEKSS